MAKTGSTKLATAVALGLLLISTGEAMGQDHSGHSPYAGMTGRDIKALAPEEVAALLAGEGMGFALSAELNGVPGPKHVLEMAEGLGLSAAQAAALEEVRARMAADARRLGAEIVEAETHLDLQFARGHATPEGVLAATVEIGRLRGELRAAHLNAHLETVKLLTASQVGDYARMRGYAAAGTPAAPAASDGLGEVRSDVVGWSRARSRPSGSGP